MRKFSLAVDSGSDLSKHLKTVRVHDGNAAEGGALLEGLDEKRLGRLELDLGVLVLGELRGVLDLGTTGLLAHLPEDLGHLAGNLRRTAEDNRGVSRLKNTRVLLDSHNSREGLDGLKLTILLDENDVSGLDLLILGDT